MGGEPKSGSERLARKAIDSKASIRVASGVAGAVGLGGAVDKAKNAAAKLSVQTIRKTGVGTAATAAVDAAAKLKKAIAPRRSGEQQGQAAGKSTGKKLAIPLVSVALVLSLVGGGMFAIQGSGGAAALMGAEPSLYATRKLSEAQINESLRMTEFYSWSAGSPSVPWELVGGITGIASKYGAHANYTNEPADRLADDAPPGSQTYPVVNPPITTAGLSPGSQGFGLGPFLVNPAHLEANEKNAREVWTKCTPIRRAEVATPQPGEFPDVASGDSAVIVLHDGTTSTTVSPYPWLKDSEECSFSLGGPSSGGGNTSPTSPSTTVPAGPTTTSPYLTPAPTIDSPFQQQQTTTTRPSTVSTTSTTIRVTTTTRPAGQAAARAGDVDLSSAVPIAFSRPAGDMNAQLNGGTLPPPLPPVSLPAITLPPPLGPTQTTTPTNTTVANPLEGRTGPPTSLVDPTAVTVPGAGSGPTGGGANQPSNPRKAVAPRSPENYPLIAPQDARAEALYVMHQLKTRAFQAFACFGRTGPQSGTPPTDVSEEDLQCWDYDPALTKAALGWVPKEGAAESTTTTAAPTTTVAGSPPADPVRRVETMEDLVDLRLTEGGIDFWRAVLKDMVYCGNGPVPATAVVAVKTPCSTAIVDQMLVEAWRLAEVEGYAELIEKACVEPPTPGSDGGSPAPTGSQTDYARIIIGIAKTENIPQRGWIVALAVAFQESGIKIYANEKVPESYNFPHDAVGRDGMSVGIFQQQVGYGWATESGADEVRQLMDPAYSAEAFFGGANGNPRALSKGLRNIDGWEEMPITVAAQKVQGSAYPDAYAKWEGPATELANANADAPPVALPVPFEGSGAGAGPAVGPPIPEASSGNACGKTSGGGGSLHGPSSNDLVALAQQQVGKRETPDGCNCGDQIQPFLGSSPGEEWCADFVSWLHKEVGRPFTGGVDGGWRLPGVLGVHRWLNDNGIWIDRGTAPAQAGDVIIFRSDSHVGIIETVDADGTIHTIEGNSSNAVSRRTYSATDTSVDGWGRQRA